MKEGTEYGQRTGVYYITTFLSCELILTYSCKAEVQRIRRREQKSFKFNLITTYLASFRPPVVSDCVNMAVHE